VSFALHPTLARDTVEVTRLALCRVLLMRDRRFRWLILVPEREAVREIHELSTADRAMLIEEIARAGETLQRLFQPDKVNVGALGNMVPQLHVRVVARFTTDSAWPGPVWGSGAAEAYSEGEIAELRERLAAFFSAPEPQTPRSSRPHPSLREEVPPVARPADGEGRE
jgi:diadenosine tetraphosphate (Ap4A) HIT family hydrolase